jgi:hypothetical protein
LLACFAAAAESELSSTQAESNGSVVVGASEVRVLLTTLREWPGHHNPSGRDPHFWRAEQNDELS